MRELKFFVKNPPASMTALEAYERKIGISLPDDFREFCLAYNGGYPECDSYPVHSRFVDFWEEYGEVREGAVAGADLLYGVPPVDAQYSCEELGKYLIDKRGLPKGWLAVAADGCGNHMLLGRNLHGWDGLYFWDSDTDGVYRIADSCGEFYNGLKESF